MLAKIVACLDVKDGVVVKGTQFKNHEIMGDIVALAKRYNEEGADEIVIYDITASTKNDLVDKSWIQKVAAVIDVPLCVAGGIRSIEDAQVVLDNGAQKISINSPALANPDLINELSETFGKSRVVVGIDSYYDQARDDYFVYALTGDPDTTLETEWRTEDWIKEVEKRGAGEIVLNMMNQDGVRSGYDLVQLAKFSALTSLPIVASGGAGAPEHFLEAYTKGNAAGTLGASAFHKKIVHIGELKDYLRANGLTAHGKINWEKVGGLLPVIVQDHQTAEVLMFGVMTPDALKKTLTEHVVTFFSRTKNRLWTKGETSGNFLKVVNYTLDCDQDTLLITVNPIGNTCHLGNVSCFDGVSNQLPWVFFSQLEKLLESRKNSDPESSYTAALYAKGTKRIAQKVGEEGVEVALAATVQDKEELVNEAADLLYHATVLLHDQDLSWQDVIAVLKRRHGQ